MYTTDLYVAPSLTCGSALWDRELPTGFEFTELPVWYKETIDTYCPNLILYFPVFVSFFASYVVDG